MSNVGFHELENYLSDIDFIFSTYIREYDIKQANINILLHEGALSISEYNKLMNAPRMYRQKSIGYMLKDKKYQEILKHGLADMRLRFLDENCLTQADILSVKKDAIYVIKKVPQITKFENVEFLNKGVFSSYVKIFRRLEIYYKSDQMNGMNVIDIKGISDRKLEMYHLDYLMNFISSILFDIESGNMNNAIQALREFHSDYVNLRLGKQYYRTFDSQSVYMIKTNSVSGSVYGVDDIEPAYLPYIDISYNLNLIREFYKIISEIYFKNNR